MHHFLFNTENSWIGGLEDRAAAALILCFLNIKNKLLLGQKLIFVSQANTASDRSDG